MRKLNFSKKTFLCFMLSCACLYFLEDRRKILIWLSVCMFAWSFGTAGPICLKIPDTAGYDSNWNIGLISIFITVLEILPITVFLLSRYMRQKRHPQYWLQPTFWAVIRVPISDNGTRNIPMQTVSLMQKWFSILKLGYVCTGKYSMFWQVIVARRAHTHTIAERVYVWVELLCKKWVLSVLNL